jgi:hypothetical protein
MIFKPYHKSLEALHIGTEKPRAYFIPYDNLQAALSGDRNSSYYLTNLCGQWSFKYFETFEDFYSAYEKQWMYIWKRVKTIIENWELHLAAISPSNMFSGTKTDSLSKGVDGYARGMKYNTTVYNVLGLGTFIDGLCAIKKYVFD